MTEHTRREKIVRFLQQTVAVAFVVWLGLLFNQWSMLSAMPTNEALGFATGQLISAVPFAMILVAAAWGFRLVVKWVLRN